MKINKATIEIITLLSASIIVIGGAKLFVNMNKSADFEKALHSYEEFIQAGSEAQLQVYRSILSHSSLK